MEKHHVLTLGSLFDGSGGFPLGAICSGIQPVWASEIEPFPIRVTTKRLPFMEHLGDVTQVNGARITPVDIITFGSPCTNLSVAGKREGLAGKQSSLFFQAIRIIKEMRCSTHGKYPRFITFENVVGCLSSSESKDYKAVLDAIIQIVEPHAEVPAAGQWSHADVLLGDGWSLAYRVIDAQHFGCAQRRKRLYLVADFGSECAGEVLFEREGVSRDFTPGCCTRQGVAGNSACGTGTAGGTTMKNPCGESPAILRTDGIAVEYQPADSRIKLKEDGICQTLCSRMGTGGNQVALTLMSRSHDQAAFAPTVFNICSDRSYSMLSGNPHSGIYEADTSRTLDCNGGNPSCNQGGMVICVQGSVVGRGDKNGPNGSGINENRAFTLTSADRHIVAFATGTVTQTGEEKMVTPMAQDYADAQVIDHPHSDQADTTDVVLASGEKTVGTLMANAGTKLWLGNQEAFTGSYFPVQTHGIRRLTPTECAVLQGFPRDWCAGLETANPTDAEIDWWAGVFETHRRIMGTSSRARSRKQIIKWLQNPYTDGAAYKMWGNGVALPCVCFVLRGIVDTVRQEQG